jgi:hypothetical protein
MARVTRLSAYSLTRGLLISKTITISHTYFFTNSFATRSRAVRARSGTPHRLLIHLSKDGWISLRCDCLQERTAALVSSL